MRRHARLLVRVPQLLPIGAALQGWIRASGPALLAAGMVELVGAVCCVPVWLRQGYTSIHAAKISAANAGTIALP